MCVFVCVFEGGGMSFIKISCGEQLSSQSGTKSTLDLKNVCVCVCVCAPASRFTRRCAHLDASARGVGIAHLLCSLLSMCSSRSRVTAMPALHPLLSPSGSSPHFSSPLSSLLLPSLPLSAPLFSSPLLSSPLCLALPFSCPAMALFFAHG